MAGCQGDKDMKEYYLNFRSQYKTLSFTLLELVFIMLYNLVELFKDNSIKVTYGTLIVSVVLLSPSIFLYVYYFYHSIYKVVKVNRYEQTIIVTQKGNSISFDINEIDKIVKICSYPVGESRTQWMPTDAFYFFKIIMKDRQEIIITSLMIDGELDIFGVNIEIEKRLFPI